MKTLSIIGLLLFLALSSFAQSVVTEKFKAEWRNVAGTKHIDTTEYDRVSLISNGSERKAYVQSLTDESGLNVWQVHIAYCLANFKYTADEESLVRASVKFLKLGNSQKGDANPEFVALYHQIVEVFKTANDLNLYRYTFEIPGDIEVISMCPLKPSPTRTIKATYQPMTIYCNCTWSGGCDGNQPCGQPQGGCRAVINCGVFDWFACSGFCGACYNGSC